MGGEDYIHEEDDWDGFFEEADKPKDPKEDWNDQATILEINSLGLIEKFEKHAQKMDAALHIRKINYDGASSFLGCNTLRCGKKLRLELPDKNEVENRTDQFRQGNISHDYHEQTLEHIKEANYLPEQIDVGSEVSIEIQPIEGVNYKVHTFIDYSYATRNKNPNAFEKGWVKDPYPVQGHHRGYQFNLLVPGSEFIQIGDIKTMTGYSFKKFQNGKLSWGYKGQFHIEMKRCGLDWIEVIGINKKTGQRHRMVYKWSDDTWNLIIQQIRDFLQLLENMGKVSKGMNITTMKDFMAFYISEGHTYIGEKNLLCLSLTKENLAWWSCPLAEKMVFKKSNWDAADGELSQKLNGLCALAKAAITPKHIESFQPGRYYLRKTKVLVTTFNPKTKKETIGFKDQTVYIESLDSDKKTAKVYLCELIRGKQSVKKPKPIKFIKEYIDDWDYLFTNYSHIKSEKQEKYLSYPTKNMIGVEKPDKL
jgi:hypothetical protein